MLKDITIKGFRSCRETTISELPAVVALIGRNAAGKTNILKAIEWIALFASGSASEDNIFQNFLSLRKGHPLAFSILVQIKRKVYSYNFALVTHREGSASDSFSVRFECLETIAAKNQNGEFACICERKGNEVKLTDQAEPIKIGGLISCLSALNSLLPSSSSVTKHLRPLWDYFRRVRYYPLDEPSDPVERFRSNWVQEEDYVKWLAQYKQNGAPGQSVLMRLIYMHLQDGLATVKETLGPNGLQLISDILIDKREPQHDGEQRKANSVYFIHFLVPSRAEGEPPLTYAQLSCGTRRLIRAMVSLLFDNGSTMLIEHPEDGIHTGLVKKIVAHLRNRSGDSQIIMSSHSLTLLNTLEPSEIRLITIDEGHTKARALTASELNAATRFISEHGGNLADFVESVEE